MLAVMTCYMGNSLVCVAELLAQLLVCHEYYIAFVQGHEAIWALAAQSCESHDAV